jgi:hypothetical protein
MGQSSIMLVLTVAFIFAITSQSSHDRINQVTDEAFSYYSKNVTKNICNSTTEMLLSKVADDETFRVNNQTEKYMLDGRFEYTLTDTVINSVDKIKIYVKAYYDGEESENTLITSIPESGFIPGSVKAAISTNNNIRTIGTLVVDGRDHKEDGSLISGEGTLGIWTTGTLWQSGNSKIGGNSSGTDYAPSRPGNSNTIKTSQTWPGGYPDSPDKVMGGAAEGFPEGYLKSVAQSGIGGSQYVTNPSDLSYPLKGITYVENSSSWKAAKIDGSGILIVHNSSTNAIIKTPKGTFTGMVIADDIDKVHGTIIGALVGISPSPASGNCVGNGKGKVLYSSEVLKKSSKSTGVSGGGNTAITNHRLKIDSWLE